MDQFSTDVDTNLASDINISLTQLSFIGRLQNSTVSPVTLAALRLAQLEDNLSVMSAVAKLTLEIVTRIESIIDNEPAAAERFGQ